MKTLPMPGELKNLIKTSVAFSDSADGDDYLKRLYFSIVGNKPDDLKILQEQNFTLREIEILTGISKSQVARQLKTEDE